MNDYEIVFRGINMGQSPYCITSISGLGSPELNSSELKISNEDGVAFGKEFFGSRKWMIAGSIKGGDPDKPSTAAQVAEAWDAMSTLLSAWDNSDVRYQVRDVTYMTFKRPGRESVRVYGRPERIDPDLEVSHAGYIKYDAIFRQADSAFYSDTEEVMLVGLVVPYAGGLLYNATQDALLLPFTTTAMTERVGAFVNTGTGITWPVITINGPVTNPLVEIRTSTSDPIWSVQFKTSLADGYSIILDTRPWIRSATRSDGANMAGTMRGSRMNEMFIPPGNNEFVYNGQDITATSTAELRYRNAWSSL